VERIRWTIFGNTQSFRGKHQPRGEFDMKRAAYTSVVLAVIAFFSSGATLAVCNATINGRPMTYQECALAVQVYGQVIPGDYWMDSSGNWVNIHYPQHRGNTYRDAQNASGGSWSGGRISSPSTVYDPSGGCEGGSCVNIID
jgi:hypothetical protein